MMTKMRSALLATLLSFAFIGCQQGLASDSGATTKDTTTTKDDPAVDPDRNHEASFVLAYVEEEHIPRTIVSVNVNGTKTEIGKVAGEATIIPPEEYAQFDVPAAALAACGGWYAGGGNYFYLAVEEGKVVLYAGWVDEGVDTEGYNWERRDF